MIRVLVVDDSAYMRELVRAVIEQTPGLQLCGSVNSGAEGVRLAAELSPDVVLMDLTMPGMDGFEATRRIMGSRRPVPVVVLTARDPGEVSKQVFECGAAEVVSKDQIGPRLGTVIQTMAGVKVVGLRVRERPITIAPARKSAPPARPTRKDAPGELRGVVLVGSSTGGPQALQALFGGLEPHPHVAFAVVQHIAAGFMGALVEWLSLSTRLTLRIAEHGRRLEPGVVTFAPGDRHLAIERGGLLSLSSAPARNGVRPAADVLFETGAAAYGDRALGLLLTGMGRDGADGLRVLYDAGAHTLTQSEESCVVYGMPREAVELGASRGQVTPREAAVAISAWSARFRAG